MDESGAGTMTSPATGRPWTADDDAALRDRYQNESAAALARDLGRAKTALYARAKKLGLRKAVRHFAPDYRPPNYLPVGATRVVPKGWVCVKVKEGGWPHAWRPLHHLAWEREHGPIPPGHVLTFRDGNPKNAEPANLELVAKIDWIKRYQPETTLPPEISRLIRLRSALVRQINKAEKENK
jgi:hypothetical protein